jgi:hypothetical protein
MSNPSLYAVIAEGSGGLDERSTEVFANLHTAVAYADRENEAAEAARVPVVHRVYRLRAFEETDLWDWGVRRSGFPVMTYVHEQAARSCVGSGELVRRRLGTEEWQPVAEDQGKGVTRGSQKDSCQ